MYTQKLLHTDAFAHRSLHTQKPPHTKLLHTEAFTQVSLYTDDLCDAAESQLYPRFCRLTVISCERVASEIPKSQFIHQCLPFNLHLSCERVRHTFVRPTGTISSEKNTFPNPPPDCTCRQKRKIWKNLRSRSFVGVQTQVDHLEVNSCEVNSCVTTAV